MDAEQDPKRRKLADFFPKLSHSEVSQVSCFLWQFQRTDVLRHPARLKHSFGRPRSLSRAESRTPEPCPSRDAENQQSRAARKERASQEVLSSIQKMEIVLFARQNSMGVTALLQTDESFANMWLPDCLVNMVPTQGGLDNERRHQ